MADFEKMYYTLFNGLSDAIERLKKAQLDAEEIFADNTSCKIIPLDKDKNTPGSK